MFAKLINSILFVILWVITVTVVTAGLGVLKNVVTVSWLPLIGYACLTLLCAWRLYLLTVQENSIVPRWLVIINVLGLSISLVYWAAGSFELLGLGYHESQLALVPPVFYFFLFFRRTIISDNKIDHSKFTLFGKILGVIAYLMAGVAIIMVLVAQVGIVLIHQFEGLGMSLSPVNWVSWAMIFQWFLPALTIRALARQMRKLSS